MPSPAPQERFESRSEEDTRALAARLAPELGAGSIVALVGDLGAGKTAFVRGLADALGLAPGERVSSPSYALVNEYLLSSPRAGADALVHLDLYRIGDDDELEAIGWRDLVAGAIVAVEWPERAARVLREASHVLTFTLAPDAPEARHITVARSPRGARAPDR